jgi:exonuclease III
LAYKANKTFRYSFVNINGLPSMAHHEKHDQIINTIQKHKIDVLGLAEVDINLPRLGPTNQWKNRLRKIRTNAHCATNKHTTSTAKRVFKGTAYITSALASHRVEQKGKDTTQLGRWTWAVFTGRQGIKTRIINGYQPIKDTARRKEGRRGSITV